MKFSLRMVTKSGRLGLISDVERLPGATFETPLMLHTTRGGTISHLTHETLEMLENPENFALLLPHSSNLRAIQGTTESKKCISEFIGMKESLSFCTVSDPLTSLSKDFNNKSSVAIWAKAGRATVSPAIYMDAMEELRPDFYQALSDSETTADSSKKRIQRSIKSTTEFFDYCFDRHTKSKVLEKSCIFASLVGGYCMESRKTLAKDMATRVVDGFLIEGLDVASEKGEMANLEEITPLVKETVNVLPEGSLLMLPGCWNPETLWSLVQEGIDIFDSSLPTLSAERGSALTFKFDPLTKKFNFTEDEKENEKAYQINLADTKHKESLEPIVRDCKCVTCRNHTKAYIHHLLTVKELLGPVLLMLHNLHHYRNFFLLMRAAIKNDS